MSKSSHPQTEKSSASITGGFADDTDIVPDVKTKNRYLKLPPELVDGQSSEIVIVDDLDVESRLRDWIEDATGGETIEIGFVEMTEAEFGALPEI